MFDYCKRRYFRAAKFVHIMRGKLFLKKIYIRLKYFHLEIWFVFHLLNAPECCHMLTDCINHTLETALSSRSTTPNR